MKLMRKEIKPNERITTFFALESRELRKSKKNNRDFLAVNLYDRTGSIKGYVWNDPAALNSTLKEGGFVKVRGAVTALKDSLIINIEKIRVAEKNEIDIRDFFKVVPGGIDHWHKKLLGEIEHIKDGDCGRVVDSFLSDNEFLEQFITSPAGISVHHNYVGGLVEHIANTMSQAASLSDRHAGLIDKDQLLTGVFLHDIGKTREIYWELSRSYTTEGRLLGHIGLGLLMLEDKLSKLNDFPDGLALLLKHMILSYHGSLEHGSPVVPATAEALALHLIENTDAKMNHLYCYLENSNPENEWSQYDKFFEYLHTATQIHWFKGSNATGSNGKPVTLEETDHVHQNSRLFLFQETIRRPQHKRTEGMGETSQGELR